MNYLPLQDMGGFVILIYLGLAAGLIAFIVTVFLEANIMKRYFPYSLKSRLGYSFTISFISFVTGIFALPLYDLLYKDGLADYGPYGWRAHIGWPIQLVLFTFLVTVVIEFICLAVLLYWIRHIRLWYPLDEPAVYDKRPKSTFWPAEKKEAPCSKCSFLVS